MRTARWLVVASAVAAAATALHLLFEDGAQGGRGAGVRRPSGRDDGPRWGLRSGEPSGSWTAGERSREGARVPDRRAEAGAPQDDIDAESREAMKDFLRGSTQSGEDGS